MMKTYSYSIFLLTIFFLLAGCGNPSSDDGETPTNKSGAINIPAKIQMTALPGTGTLTASIYIDGNTAAASTKEIGLSDTDTSFSLSVEPGDHTFTIVFSYTDTGFGNTYELARATSGTVNVTSGGNSNVTFLDSDYTYADDDNDGLTNLAELDETVRTDPNDNSCFVESSKLDLCALGS